MGEMSAHSAYARNTGTIEATGGTLELLSTLVNGTIHGGSTLTNSATGQCSPATCDTA